MNLARFWSLLPARLSILTLIVPGFCFVSVGFYEFSQFSKWHSAAVGGVFQGKVADLPEAAQDVLTFRPSDTGDQGIGETVRDDILDECALTDFVGATDFPGTIEVSPPAAHGWVRVTWKPGNCGGDGGAAHPNPTLIFDISADQDHLREVGDSNGNASSGNATYDLTH